MDTEKNFLDYLVENIGKNILSHDESQPIELFLEKTINASLFQSGIPAKTESKNINYEFTHLFNQKEKHQKPLEKQTLYIEPSTIKLIENTKHYSLTVFVKFSLKKDIKEKEIETLNFNTEIRKSIVGYILFRKKTEIITEYFQSLNLRLLFTGHWTRDYVNNLVKRALAIKELKIDERTHADAINPIILACWQQWTLRKDDSMASNIKRLLSAIILNNEKPNNKNFKIGIKLDSIQLHNFVISTLIETRERLNKIENTKESKINSTLIKTLFPPTEPEKNNSKSNNICALSLCVIINNQDSKNIKKIKSNKEFKLFLFKAIHASFAEYLTRQNMLNSESSQRKMIRLNRPNLYIWLVYSLLSVVINENDEKSLKILSNQMLFEDICYLVESTSRYLLFRSNDYLFESSPILTAKKLLRIINKHAELVINTKLPSRLVQLLQNSLKREHKFNRLKDSSQHVQHSTDLYLLGEYLASEDFKLTNARNNREILDEPLKRSYALASLFHDIGMLREYSETEFKWHTFSSIDEYIDYLTNIKFVSAKEALDIKQYEHFPHQEHAFTSAVTLHKEICEYNRHRPQNISQVLQMKDPVEAAVKSVLFHSMCYLPTESSKSNDINVHSAMLLALTDAIYTWRPSSTTIGRPRNLISEGFGASIQSDIARYDDKQLEIINGNIFLIRDSVVGQSIQYTLKLIQSFGRLSFTDLQWLPIVLLEVDDKDCLLQELHEIRHTMYHEVCSGLEHWIELQEKFSKALIEAVPTSSPTAANDPDSSDSSSSPSSSEQKSRLSAIVESLIQPEVLQQLNMTAKSIAEKTLYIESGTKPLGNFDVTKFVELPEIKEYIRNQSQFY
ncbi:hypothetical protein KIH87_13400 [Paraneptunicella aestuarii]|uniref:hypothetical protein n=1 Tax=Paraneptunicella aestuarii TaxID=2831148 RepID=UPI001E2AB27F|nr:hypothetical protein [Paraneptunicella aestuarii]UAA37699.1 hypothetical protein KIH87_13400 [Paraneptunicella aestuarii]